MKKIIINITAVCAAALTLVGYTCCVLAGNADYTLGYK